MSGRPFTIYFHDEICGVCNDPLAYCETCRFYFCASCDACECEEDECTD